MAFGVTDIQGQVFGSALVRVYGSNGRLKFPTGGGSAAWGSIGAGTGVGSQADLVAYLTANYQQLVAGTLGDLFVHNGTTWTASKTLTGEYILNDNSSGTAFRITQVGSGDALLVEDSTNPDSTPFVIKGDGKTGIGTLTPLTTLHMAAGSSGVASIFTGTTGIFESSSTNYISLLAPDSSYSGFVFGAPSDNFGAYIRWRNSDNALHIATAQASGQVIFYTGNGSELTRMTSAGLVVGGTSPSARLHSIPSATGIGLQVSGTSSATMVKINQTGTGDALLVEDDVSPDATPFCIKADGTVIVGTTTPDASAILKIDSVTKGILIPRMTTAERVAIASPATGLLVYDSTLNQFYYYNGSAWTAIGGGGGGVTSVTATAPLTSSGGATPDISTSMNTNKLIGRSTAGVGVMEEISLGSGVSLSGGTLVGTAAYDAYSATLTTDTNDLNASVVANGYILLSPTTNVKLTGLQGGATGRLITLINTSSSYTILIENNTTSSSAGNRFFNPGGEYLIMLPGESLTFNYYNNQWNSAHLPFEQQLELFSDLTGYATGSGNFTNGAYFVDGPWRFLGGGSTPTSNTLPRPVTNQKKGIVQITMSRSPTVLIFYGSPISGFSNGGVADASAGTTRFVNGRFTTGDVTFNAATQNIECTLGIANGGGIGASAFGAYWNANANYANWQCVTDVGATSTITDSGLPVVASVTTPPAASEYYTLGVVVHRSNGVSTSNAGFFSVNVNGVITWNVREVNTNIPTSNCSPTLCWNGLGTLINTAPNIYIDYLGYKIIGGTR